MDIFTALNQQSEYSKTKLQVILGAWVASAFFEAKAKVSTSSGDVAEEDYDKQSIYSLLYSLYRSMDVVRSDIGEPYVLTFNTWGYDWPASWGKKPVPPSDPQRFGKNAYTGLYEFAEVKDYVAGKSGKVHVVEMGCGTGAGAHHVCEAILPECTYEAVDMQLAAIETCKRRFVPRLGGRLAATHADCTQMPVRASSTDIVAVCETHVTEHGGQVTDEDRAFFSSAHRTLKPGGFLVWGNAIPDSTWQPCFDYLESIGMRKLDVRDVTKQAVIARDLDQRRVDAYVQHCLDAFWVFGIPVVGPKRRREAELAMKNFYRNPGTNLYDNMTNGTDTYKVVLFQKQS